MTLRQLGIFAKYWKAGQVKTRLAKGVGKAAASQLYRCFVERLAARFQNTADRRVLYYSPPERREAFALLAGADWKIAPQSGDDLGERMKAYFDEAFAAGAEQVVLIGSDSPTLPIAYVDAAFEQLHEHPVVLGPSDDGGYYLIGARGATPPIFDQIAWSTAEVWPQTLQHLAAAGMTFGETPAYYDIDTVADLPRLQTDLAGDNHPGDQHLQRLIAASLNGVQA
ncbi:TIGR04282 family arsenosugar biosynthesis glycosyltransferase [Lignipirellula cremea]|uniref:2-phospho-L-lactate guanylyltransferase n=1 Tax=Lignipirellula cremea TaxID=2528010 RepID=A0A518E329_9BACT|nr:TIGR04282 family arsenosugar biosynthesis glycosyltransferase [Lignipirellula cremea]QDU98494.1 2-phospho-L-lactate guanylyltransferase [Lignipirellula cremea]